MGVVQEMTEDHRDAPLPATEHEAVRKRLTTRRAETDAQITALTREYEGIVEANSLVAVDDEHDPEGSNTAFERQHVAALLQQARDRLDDLERALTRLEQGGYGRCEGCGEPIPAERLEARPATTTCVPCAKSRPR